MRTIWVLRASYGPTRFQVAYRSRGCANDALMRLQARGFTVERTRVQAAS